MAISSPDTDALFRDYRESRDPGVRATLVERFLPLARRLARRYERGGESFDDLLQVASLGLVKAVDRYEPNRGVAFSSYAVPTILGELKRYFRDTGWAVHVPRGLQERAMKVDQTSAKLDDAARAGAVDRRRRRGHGPRARGRARGDGRLAGL